MKYRVVGGSLNVRKKPTTESEVIHVLARGEEINAGAEKDGWRKFGSGYVMAQWLEPVMEEEPVPEPAKAEAQPDSDPNETQDAPAKKKKNAKK